MKLNVKGIILKLLNRNTGECLYKPRATESFQLDYIKIKNFCSPKQKHKNIKS